MSVSLSQETFDSLRRDWQAVQTTSRADHVFSFPEWQELCWNQFRKPSGAQLYLASIRKDSRIIGIAPLVISGDTATFIGTANVCDYLDFIVSIGHEDVFFDTLLPALRALGLKRLELEPLRSDSAAMLYLSKLFTPSDMAINCVPLDVSVELSLPATWESFIEQLDSKQKHEVRRKLKRIDEAGKVAHHVSLDANHNQIEMFLHLMRTSRKDKALFMTPVMEIYFRTLADIMAERGVLRLGYLLLNDKPAAATMSFDYGNSTYLYNSGYDPDYARLNVGLVSKLFCIRDSIERGRRTFDFLKGGEVYKFRLGGHKVPLYRCRLNLNSKLVLPVGEA